MRPSATMVRSLTLAAALALAACEASAPPEMVIFVDEAHADPVRAFAEPLPDGVEVRVVADPETALGSAPEAPQVALVADPSCAECYRVERAGAGALVHGGAPAGLQYGLAELLEAMGFRFYHPMRSLEPERLALPAAGHSVYGPTHEPEMSVRGLHLHTLHPVEAYYATLEPGEESLERARRIVDWIVKNRGNFVQWFLLNHVDDDPVAAEAWRAHTRAIVDYAHMRGVRVGLAVQLFSGANLQKGFDLTTGGANAPAEITASLDLLDGLGFDALQLNFGEFSDEEPGRFLELIDLATAEALARWPHIEVGASIHVGANLRLDYGGETDLLYYFLVRFADPRIVPWIHTVMYYTLFDDAGGAYHHEDFSEHRDYLYQRLRDDLPVVYYPETAYWVAFDNTVPTYLPVYIRSRWRDQARIREDAAAMGMSPLERHVTFTSGWEWGYWQQDYLTLRSHYELPARWQDGIERMLAPHGEQGAAAAAAIAAVAELQHQHLIDGRLAPYFAGRDSLIELGFTMGIVGQPDRVTFAQLLEAGEAERAAFVEQVLEPLEALADGTEAASSGLAEVDPEAEPWLAEVGDGLAVDVHRARFVAALYRAVLARASGGDPAPELERAQAELDAARAVVDRRHAHMHDPEPARLTARRQHNETLYRYGYLREAEQLCFWSREQALARNLLLGTEDRVPGCVL